MSIQSTCKTDNDCTKIANGTCCAYFKLETLSTTPSADEALKVGIILALTGIKSVGDSAHSCYPKKALEDEQKTANTPNHLKGKDFDFKVYCD